MKKTVKSCYRCRDLYVVYIQTTDDRCCKKCRIAQQREAEKKLIQYMHGKYVGTSAQILNN